MRVCRDSLVGTATRQCLQMNGVSPNEPSHPTQPGGHRWRVLVVDPSAVSRRSLCAFLQEHPALEPVGACETGAAALALAARLQPEVVLVELTVPGLWTEAVIAQLARICPQARLWLMSVHATAEARRLAQEAGAVGLLDKHRLIEQLEQALGIRQGPGPTHQG